MSNSVTESAAYAAPEFVFLLFWGATQLIIRPAGAKETIVGLLHVRLAGPRSSLHHFAGSVCQEFFSYFAAHLK